MSIGSMLRIGRFTRYLDSLVAEILGRFAGAAFGKKTLRLIASIASSEENSVD